MKEISVPNPLQLSVHRVSTLFQNKHTHNEYMYLANTSYLDMKWAIIKIFSKLFYNSTLDLQKNSFILTQQ
jgi:hypothetical protein